jgi:CRISPR/Cas system-associated exonuclease Cas4 (RecB family)
VGEIRLSPSSTNVFLDCPRCFWLEKNRKIKRPRGPFPSLPNGMDREIKRYYDRCRAEGMLPSELAGRVSGVLFPDQVLMKKWRHYKSTPLKYVCPETGAILSGALDDCLVDGGILTPLDYKTKGGALKEADIIGTYYQNQMNSYELMLAASGYGTRGEGVLVYYYPAEVRESGITQFTVEPVILKTDPEDAKGVVLRAAQCWRSPEPPEPNPGCEYCNYSMIGGL